MNNYFYPAVFTYDEESKCYIVDFIDLKGCSTYGTSIDEAYIMAKDALGLYLSDLDTFPKPTIPYNHVKLKDNQFISIIEIDLQEYRKKYSNIAVKKTLSIPTWLNTLAEKKEINFSQLLQKALKAELNIPN
jgi:antitoxin HicB